MLTIEQIGTVIISNNSNSMDTLEIQHYLKMIHPSLESNVYAANRLPMYTHVPTYIICNLDTDNKPGTHWIALHIDANGSGQYFDSYGRAPTRYHLEFLKRNCKRWDWNVDTIQNDWTSVCGEYCLMYLLYKFRRFSMDSFVKIFTGNTLYNDVLVDTMFRSYFID